MQIGMGLATTMRRMGSRIARLWLLVTGEWHDAGKWDDNATWNDGA